MEANQFAQLEFLRQNTQIFALIDSSILVQFWKITLFELKSKIDQ